MVIALVPHGTGVAQLAARKLSPGLLSAGLGSVAAAQTYLDISQGNRVFDSLYDEKLPPKKPELSPTACRAWWQAATKRADSAPADVVPDLLVSTLEAAGVGVRVGGGASCTFSSPTSRRQRLHSPPKKLSGTPHPHPPTNLFEARSSSLEGLAHLVGKLRPSDLLIAIERAPPAKDRALAIGVAGRGFDGDLTSDSTRTDGYVLSTDVAPTILERLGIGVPSEMSGQAIRAEHAVDVAHIEALGDRMAVIPTRRGPVIGVSLLVWLVVFGIVVLVSADRVTRIAVRLTALSVVYLPLMLLAGAALEPTREGEQLLVLVGAPLLAAVTLRMLRGFRALALASGVVVLAYAIDVIGGSQLTSVSLLGPNPGLGVRFYGIGNELEATLGVLVVGGAGAALAGWWPRLAPRRAAVVFLAGGLLCAAVFAAGRFGADVGAAIVLPAGAAAAAVGISGGGRRTSLLVIAAPLALLALIALADLVSGANAHFTRSVLDAGGLGDLGDVAQRRLQLSAHSFVRPIVFAFLPLIAAAAALAAARRGRLRAWLAPFPAVRAGLLGALAATLVGTLANDSGALLLEIGAAYLLAFLAYSWSEAPT